LGIISGAKGVFRKVFKSSNERALEQLAPIVARINELESRYENFTDSQFLEETARFRERLHAGESLDDILPEVFALVREAAKQTLGERHFDVQLMGGIVLHQGKIAEMVTGEGKTLTATLPVSLNALTGRGVHIVTTNDFLASRDTEWMGPIYRKLGLTVGCIRTNTSKAERQAAYRADITYGQNNEFGFDYLRDNMEMSWEDRVQRELHYAIVDEVDSILIDEARTPLIISGPAFDSTDKYYRANQVAKQLKEGIHFQIKIKENSVVLTDEGIVEAERLIGQGSFYEGRNMDWPHHVDQALRALHLFKRDRDYIVKDGQVIIVDEFTGRLMEGRHWSDGLHQAVEAKENLKIKEENQTLATITFQNYFRMYEKLAGMTGTAATEAAELMSIYGLDVVVIPTNKPLRRSNHPDIIFRTEEEKFKAIIDQIVELHEQGRPVLVGTTSIENSERLSRMLSRRDIEHEVLNAKHHEKEAAIIAKAGQAGNVTIATNMAGRGTDIKLGEGVAERGGLAIIGTERHEARRIDNQLRGRAGRQGDPGSSVFYLSLDDQLLKRFGGERLKTIFTKLGMREGEELQSGMVSRAIERAQRRFEEFNFEIRKNLLEYDKVMDEQRKSVYSQRNRILRGEGLRETVAEMISDETRLAIDTYLVGSPGDETWDTKGLAAWAREKFLIEVMPKELEGLSPEQAAEKLNALALEAYDALEAERGKEFHESIIQYVLLHTIDVKWKDHLRQMDILRSSVGLRGYGQKDPKLEYQREGFELFEEMRASVAEEATGLIFRVKIADEADRMSAWSGQQAVHSEFDAYDRSREEAVAASHAGGPAEPFRRKEPKIGRNDPCPCGSGRKYKKCCARRQGV